MTAKEWLMQGWKINDEIEALEQTKINLFLRCTRVTPTYSKTGGTDSPDPHKMDGYAAYCERVDQKIRELTNISAEIFGVICRVQNVKYRTLLVHRYLNFRDWNGIAKSMGYDVRHITRLHGEALEAVKHVLECP